MIIAIKNSEEKSAIIKYLNKSRGTNHPTTFFIEVGGYIALDGNDYIHFTTFEKAAEYARGSNKVFLSFIDFVERLIDENAALQQDCECLEEAYHTVKDAYTDLSISKDISTTLFTKIFNL